VEQPPLKARGAGAALDGEGFSVLPHGGDGDGTPSLWDDDQAATFYESLPEIAAVVPQLALARDMDAAAGDGTAAHDDDDVGGAAEPEAPSGADEQLQARTTADTDAADPGGDEAAGDSADTSDPNYEALRRIHEQLAACSRVEQADEISINFCFIQTKGAPCELVGLSSSCP
jgi:hypothetical protein